jgi:hypothetical protein
VNRFGLEDRGRFILSLLWLRSVGEINSRSGICPCKLARIRIDWKEKEETVLTKSACFRLKNYAAQSNRENPYDIAIKRIMSLLALKTEQSNRIVLVGRCTLSCLARSKRIGGCNSVG